MPMGAFLSANGEKLITLERGREPNLLSLAAPPLRFRVTDLANGQSRPGPQMNSRDGRDAYVRAVSPDRLFYIDQRLRLWKGPE